MKCVVCQTKMAYGLSEEGMCYQCPKCGLKKLAQIQIESKNSERGSGGMLSWEQKVNITDRLSELFKTCESKEDVYTIASELKGIVDVVVNDVILEEFTQMESGAFRE